MPEQKYEFGPFLYDPGQRVLFRDGTVVPLAPKALDTPHVLLERRGQVVGKAELMKRVWPGTVVEEIGLARNISALRKALDDEEGVYIETIPKRGYRFVGEGRQGGGRSARRLAAAAAALLGALVYWQFYRPSRFLGGSGDEASLAVAPFECLTGELRAMHFPEGLEEVLVARLAQIEGVRVTSPSTVRRYRTTHVPVQVMARVLGLDVLVEGSVQQAGERILVTARLADVHSGKLIWADTFEYAARDTAAAQQEAASAIAGRAGAHLAIHGRVRGR